MYHLRPFRNDDPPVLAELWNESLPDVGAARPLGVHEFDGLIMGKLHFDAEGLIVAVREADRKIVGFVHAGFGPVEPEGPSLALDRELGAIVMYAVEPGLDDPELDRRLILAAERYLRDRGAKVIYAGGQYPLNPFYWGLYGGSEFAGILGGHVGFRRAVDRAGYQAVATSVLWEADLVRPEIRDPKALLLRRLTRVEVGDDAPFERWWDSLALGHFRPTIYRLSSKIDGRYLAGAATWEMLGFRRDGLCRTGLISLDVAADQRRKGYGRHLVAEVLRHARTQMTEVVGVVTSMENAPALALYKSAGFAEVDVAVLYRLPSAETDGRPIGQEW